MTNGEQDLREQIITASLKLFREKGYRATSLKDILSAANCSTGGFYHHFASKDDLLFLIHDKFITDGLERCQAIHDRKDTATNRLSDVMINIVENVAHWRDHVTVFFEERRFLSSEKFAIVLQKREAYDQLVKDIIEEGIRDGEFDAEISASIIAFGIYGMVHWTYQWMRSDGTLSAREIGECFAKIAMHGLVIDRKKRPSTRPASRADAQSPAAA